MSDDVQRLRAWQIKDFPEAKRKMVIRRAEDADKTVAEWLEPVIDQALEGFTAPVTGVNRRAPSVEELCKVVEAACQFAQHRAGMQRPLAAAISRRLQGMLLPENQITEPVNAAAVEDASPTAPVAFISHVAA